MADIRIDYDDNGADIIDKISKVLEKKTGYKLKDDGLEHDGYILLDIIYECSLPGEYQPKLGLGQATKFQCKNCGYILGLYLNITWKNRPARYDCPCQNGDFIRLEEERHGR